MKARVGCRLQPRPRWGGESALGFFEDALRHIRPDIEYGEWIQLAYAVHDYGSTSNRKRLFEQWSEGGEKYDGAAKRSIKPIWSNAPMGAGVAAATLVHNAKANRWESSTPRTGRSGARSGFNIEDRPC